MCQAYEAEYSFIVTYERINTTLGFFAAADGKPITTNPNPWDKYYKDAWDHGWRCFGERLLPWSIESRLKYPERIKSREYLKRTGKISAAIKKLR